jgi:ribosomal protein S18 acetylase RimI-like enzyme
MVSVIARPDDLDSVTTCITLAFASDPVWSVALVGRDGRGDHLAAYWRLFVLGAMRFGTVHRTPEGEAVSVWLPPDGTELTPELTNELETLIAGSLAADRVAALHELYDRFETSRAGVPPGHAYLSLLATHPEHRGRGVGQALLADDLAAWDGAAIPAYLESTNPANDHRYARAGFTPVGRFDAVLDDARITAMWRPVGVAAGAATA